MGRCTNKVSQYVPRGYGYKEVKTRCGSTGIHGQQLLCDSCTKKLQVKYPQGWRDVPGDICKHGNYVGDAGGPDYLCPACESEGQEKYDGDRCQECGSPDIYLDDYGACVCKRCYDNNAGIRGHLAHSYENDPTREY